MGHTTYIQVSFSNPMYIHQGTLKVHIGTYNTQNFMLSLAKSHTEQLCQNNYLHHEEKEKKYQKQLL